MEQSFGSTEGRGDQGGCLIAPTSGAVRLTHRGHCPDRWQWTRIVRQILTDGGVEC